MEAPETVAIVLKQPAPLVLSTSRRQTGGKRARGGRVPETADHPTKDRKEAWRWKHRHSSRRIRYHCSEEEAAGFCPPTSRASSLVVVVVVVVVVVSCIPLQRPNF